ncbi:MAG: chemotaxis protein CheW [Myxococcota bacterium]
MDDGDFLTFTVDGLLLALPVDRVEEVLRQHSLTPVPLSASCVAGLMNLRGQIVLAVDLRDRLGLDPLPDPSRMHVVIRGDSGLHSLLVDSIGDVISMAGYPRDRVPERVSSTLRSLATAVYRLPDRLLLALDADRLVDPAVLQGA